MSLVRASKLGIGMRTENRMERRRRRRSSPGAPRALHCCAGDSGRYVVMHRCWWRRAIAAVRAVVLAAALPQIRSSRKLEEGWQGRAKPPGSSPLTVADRPYSNNGSGVPGSRPPLNRCFFNDPPRPPRLPNACTSSHNPSPKLGWAAFLFPLWNCFHLLIPLIELIPLFTN